MNINTFLHPHTLLLSPPFPPLPKTDLTRRTITLSPSTSQLLHHPQTRKFHTKVVRCFMKEDEILGVDDAQLLVETCITRTLPPALTFEQGLAKISEAVEELKCRPPCCASGMYRIQVAVPPSAKALSWFCCQPESSIVFPQFFLSREVGNPTYRSLSVNRTRGIFGLGTAVCIKGSFSRASSEFSAFQRYLSVDSTSVMAYGFMDINFDMISSSVKHETGSFYLFIPLIELDEFEGMSMLATTLAWNDSSFRTFEEAVQTCELSFSQARQHFLPITEECCNKRISSALRKFNILEDKNAQLVRMSVLLLGGRDLAADHMELKDASCFHQFSVRLSPTLVIANNMYQLDLVSERGLSWQDYPNINALWASLIIEECSRLGLTYFCVAPGSRSSPLAIAASSHPLATCIACFDERSLAFHAVGYGRGSRKPAVVITSSGTAVSNLLPAVVEASQDFVPLILLTADRPPELQDAGANQAINQVNHFGSFVRHFFSLPTPTDTIPARMVLTTLDSAVYMATSAPCGPVHINCPFREPLEDCQRMWMLSCLKGLEFWMSSAETFTSYIRMQHSFACNDTEGHMADILKIIHGANRGLLLIGALHTEDDIWAALLLAKFLFWPAVADVLSGLRLRKYLTSFSGIEKNLFIVDHLDHLLLSNSVREWLQPDVIVQIGSRITSKRISQMLEDCFPCSYIVVDKHPSRCDPSHIVTHRIQSAITHFTDCLLKYCTPQISSKWSGFLRALNMMVARELSLLIHSEHSLTEPYVAYVILEALQCESAIFLGNSMPIRDADMYGCSWANCTHSTMKILDSGLPCHWIQVAGNRGASGIDGLLSTAVGFAVGCNKRVLCVIGDISFLHDTNGLALLTKRIRRKPMTILVINNHGGAIFSLLPIADRTERRVLNEYFYTSHDISIHNLCMAHGVKHVKVQKKMELLDALFTSQQEETDCVIEVESCIDANATFHSNVKKFASQAADHALSILSRLSVSDSVLHGFMFCKIYKMEYSLYRIQLCAPTTTASVNYDPTTLYREGFIIALSLEDGSAGFGEVAPLEIHKENLLDVEEQLRFLIHVIEGAKIDYFLPLLKGSFSSWIWNSLGILPGSIFPSVRCGLEMAVLNAIAAREGCSLLNILHSHINEQEQISGRSPNVKICALIDSDGSPMDVAYIATTLAVEGFSAIKLKVARRADPIEDASVIQEVRRKVGHRIELRADANRKWTYDEAIRFGSAVKNCNLQYIEEPVQDEDDIIKFCEETGLPVALDETMDNIKENHLEVLAKFTHSRVVAIVIKPSIVGGFENAALIARWAQQHGKMAVVSAAFESSLGLLAYIQFSCYLELQNEALCRVMNNEPALSIAHGLGTYRWLKEDVTSEPLIIQQNPHSGFAEASVVDAGRLLQTFQFNHNAIVRTFCGEQVRKYQLSIDSEHFSLSFNVQEIGSSIDNSVLVFLHGFLGIGEDWIPIMKAISGAARCVAIDLPGHGGSKLQINSRHEAAQGQNLSIEVVADALCKLLHCLTPRKVTLVGYSMGARIALYMALKCSDKVEGAVIISGSPGLNNVEARKVRWAKDDFRACTLVSYGLEFFLDSWYAGELWNSLRGHPHFNQIVANRMQHDDVHTLAKVLSDLSIGRQLPLWEDLKNCRLPILIVVGERDAKFKRIAQEMCCVMSSGASPDRPEVVEIPDCGHAAHLENPLPVIRAVRQFLTRVQPFDA